MQTEIPRIDICSLSGDREEDIIISRFSEYLSRHHHNLVAPHRHSFFHLLFFTEGGGKHTIDFLHFDVRPYQVYFMKPGQVHSWDFEGKVEGYVVNFSEGFFRSFLLKQDYLDSFTFLRGYPQSSVLNLEGDTRQKVGSLFETLLALDGVSAEFRDDMARTLLLQIFMTVQDSILAGEYGREFQLSNALLRNYQKLIEKNFIEFRLPGEYAALLNITPNHLNALCKEQMGRQAGQLIRDRLVLEAKRLLVNIDLTISEIAYKLNFKDNSYFSRFFRKETGISPEAFRKKHAR